MTESEMRTMQQEAVRRAQEMQSRAKAVQRQMNERHGYSGENYMPPDAEQNSNSTKPNIGFNVPNRTAAVNRHIDEPNRSPVSHLQSEEKRTNRDNEAHFGARGKEESGIFGTLLKDKEKTLILCLILLLMDEKTDNSLVLALLYILM